MSANSPKKLAESVSEGLKTRVESMVNKHMSDTDIARRLGFKVDYVYWLRVKILHISYYGKKKLCPRCGQQRALTCFKTGSPFCIICRRETGECQPYHRTADPVTIHNNAIRMRAPKKEIFICLRCECAFESEVWGNHLHNHCCEACRKIIDVTDRLSI